MTGFQRSGRPTIPLPLEFDTWRRAGLSTQEIARRAGVSPKTARRWVSGVAGVFSPRVVSTDEQRRARRRETDRARYVPHPKPAALTDEEKRARRRAYGQRPEVKARRLAKVKARYRDDPVFKLNMRMRAQMWRVLHRNGQRKAHRSWEALVGYSAAALKVHIERQFPRGMSWDNADRWHVDHIHAVASFGHMEPGDEAFRACWAMANLRPLWKARNLAKGATREHLI